MMVLYLGARRGSDKAAWRIFTFFFVTHLGRILAGSCFLISGLIYGLHSHTVVYQQDFSGDYSGTLDFHDVSYYLRPHNTGDKYYIIKIEDFTPLPSDLTADGKSPIFTSLTYRNEPQNLNNQDNPDNPIVGTGYQVIEFTVVNSDGSRQEYTTSDYREHPHGFYENDWWGYGAIGIILGLIFFCLSLFVYWLDKRAAARALATPS